MGLLDYAKKKKDQLVGVYKNDASTLGIAKNTVKGLGSALNQVVQKGPAAAYYDANPKAAINVNRATAFRMPEELAGNLFSGVKDFTKTAGGAIGEGLAYAIDPEVRKQYQAGNTDILPTVSKVSPLQMIGKTTRAGLEVYTPKFLQGAAKAKALPTGATNAQRLFEYGKRAAVAAPAGYAYDVSNRIADGANLKEKSTYTPGVGTAVSALFGAGMKPAAQMYRDDKTIRPLVEIAKQVPQATRNSIRNRRPGAITQESIPAHWVKTNKIAEFNPATGRIAGNQSKVRGYGDTFDNGFQTRGQKVQQRLPEQVVERGRKTPTVSDLLRQTREALPRPGMSIQAVDDPLLSEARKYATPEEFVKAQVNTYHGSPVGELGEIRAGAGEQKLPVAYISKEMATAEQYTGTRKVEADKLMAARESAQAEYELTNSSESLARLESIDKKLGALIKESQSGAVTDTHFSGRSLSPVKDSKEVQALFLRADTSTWTPREQRIVKNIVSNGGSELSPQIVDSSPNIRKFLVENGVDGLEYPHSALPYTNGKEGTQIAVLNDKSLYTKSQLTDLWKKAQGGKTLSDLGKEAIEALPRPGMSIQAVGGGKPTKFGSRVTPENRSNPSSYDQVTQQDILTKAKGNMKIGFDFALKQARNEKLGAEANATAMGLIDDAIKSEKWDTLDMLLKEFAPRFSKQGQEINILNRWGRLTPAGAVRYTQHIINKAVEATKQQIEFTPEAKQEIVALAEAVQNVEPGTREQTIAIAKLFGKIQEQIPTSFLRKVSTIQTMAQLLNPKTAIRNVIGNAGFAVGEAISDTAAVPIDMATSLFTGKRTKALPSLTTLGKGFGKGLREGAEEAGLGIDTKGLPGQFDMPTAPTFKGKVGSFFEKGLAYELKATDRAFYQASYDDSLRQQMKLAGISTPTPEMQEIAHADGLYRTFQDDSKAAWLFTKIKQGLNLGQDWGLGDIILKYPKTPGNLLSRAIEYSPAGYAKGLLEVAKPLVTKTPFNQKAFVEALSRGTVGSAGLVGMGFLLAKLGIITGEPSSDKDINALERSEGSGPYRLNASAAKRFLFGGDTTPKDGDLMVSYDWLQPFAVPLSIGANAQKDGATLRGSKNVAIESMTSGINTLAEQPLMQGMKRLFGYGDVAGGLSDTLSSAGASFVPTFLNQIRQLTDNTARETRGGSDMERALNTAKAKIPGLASDLPPQYTTLGEERETYQNGSNTWLNVFFNPAFVSRLESTPAGKEVMDIYQNSGETQQFPRVVPKTLEINNGESKEKLQLSNEQLSEYQKYVGERTKATFDKLASDQEFQKLADEEKAKYMADALSDINTAAKIELFGHKTSNSYVKGAAPYMDGTPEYETNETSLSKQKLLLYKQRKDTESWMKEADSLYKQYAKALQDENLTEIDRVRITKDMETLAEQFNKYKSYGGFTKPKSAKKPKSIKISSAKNDADFIVKKATSRLRPLRAFSSRRTNLASVRRPSITRKKLRAYA